MTITCKRCGAGPYDTQANWDNHVAIHRQMDDLSETARPGTKAALQGWIEQMEAQVVEVARELQGR